jgi:WD40 repeat protein
VSSVVLSPDGQTLISGSLDNTIKVWNLNSGEELRSLPRQPSIVESISLSPDGQTLASGGWGNIIKLWNLNTGQETRILSKPADEPTQIYRNLTQKTPTQQQGHF